MEEWFIITYLKEKINNKKPLSISEVLLFVGIFSEYYSKYINIMRILKSFTLFESGNPNRLTQDLQKEISGYFSNSIYSPNIITDYNDEFTRQDSPEFVNFTVLISSNQSKYGQLLEVRFLIEKPFKISQLNEEFKSGLFSLDVGDLISKILNKEILFYGFDFFGKKVMGQKDGRTLQVEDVQPKFTQLVETMCQEEPEKRFIGYTPIILWYLIK
jgi:hypothetical protein